ncbi:ATP-dependent Lon protease pim1 [Gryganskiella cystojenkinii]|nr:ATP-dependent Lon protease pim1 [Gryganskiella cystojenkinii]
MATASVVQSHPRRNLIHIPRDIYRKHTSSSTTARDSHNVHNDTHNDTSSIHSSTYGRSTRSTRTRPARLLTKPNHNQNHSHQTNPTSTLTTSNLAKQGQSTPSPSPPPPYLFRPSSPNTFPSSSLATNYAPPSPSYTPPSPTLPAKIQIQSRRSKRKQQTSSSDADGGPGAETLASPTPTPEATSKRIRLRLNSHAPPPALPEFAGRLPQSSSSHQIIVISDDSDSETISSSARNHTSTGRERSASVPSTSSRKGGPKLAKEQTQIVESIFPEQSDNQGHLRRAFLYSPEFSQNYRIGRLLGSGSSGFVLSARCLENGREVAIKVIPTDKRVRPDATANKVNREIDILTFLKAHDNILEFVEVFTMRLPGEEVVDLYFIVTELGETSLFEFIERHRLDDASDTRRRHRRASDFPSGIRKDVVHSIFKQLARGLHSMHSQNVVHGDIKDENALVNSDSATGTCRAKLCDFGHAKRMNAASGATFVNYGTTIMGPPEMDKNIKRKEQLTAGKISSVPLEEWDRFYGFEADVFALGLLLYTLIHGDLPGELGETNPARLAAYRRRRGSSRTFPFAVLVEGLDNDLVALLKGMLAVRPKYRMSMDDVLGHSWVKMDRPAARSL